jgi:hypothetical protein
MYSFFEGIIDSKFDAVSAKVECGKQKFSNSFLKFAVSGAGLLTGRLPEGSRSYIRAP